MTNAPNIIQPLTSSLAGRVLIEASAGTGKTYTITSLVIRYLLGINLPEPFKLEEILIVTFTKAATAELRLRIYARILDVNQAFKNARSDDPFIQDILSLIPIEEYTKARSILNDAERLMSDANIFTIHGFCQRFLSQNPLDSLLPFDFTLETSDTEIKEATAKQFWREYCYYFSDSLASIAYKVYKNPQHVHNTVNRFLGIAHELRAPDTIADLESEVFSAHNESGELDDIQIENILWSFATQKFKTLLSTEQEKQGRLFFDDLIQKTHQMIESADATTLRHIRHRYKVAMIDEFQDTDAIQYQIFSKLFGTTDAQSLLMIGDPKQSIYRFRGADIDTYLTAKRDAISHYSLGTNYRSSSVLVDGINTLFSQNPTPFLNSDIPFIRVDTPSSAQSQYLSYNDEPQKGIGIAYLADANNKGSFRQATAQYITQRIQALLKDGKIHHDGQARPISNQDITILVRSVSDAIPILNALKDAQLPAVYLSDKNKVFSSEAADLLKLFLKSLLDNRNQELMKQTFASLLYQLSLNELHELLNNHRQYEDFLLERELCLVEWDKIGIIPMMDAFLHRHHRIHRFRNHPRFDRIMTDIRHLTELLHAQSLLSPTKEALLEWFEYQTSSPDQSDDNLGASSNSLRLESEMNVITIMTIHGSKGLEFPITFIPSMFETQTPKPPFIITQDDGQKCIDYHKDNEAHIAEKLSEEQAENMRLLYVALTRAKYYCEFALSEIFLNRTTNINDKVVYSILLNTPDNAPFTQEHLSTLEHIQLLPMDQQISVDYVAPHIDVTTLTAAKFTGKIDHSWGVSSFTQLTRNAHQSYFQQENADEFETLDTTPESIAHPHPSIFTFPKGPQTGTFFHELFEKHRPNDLLKIDYLTELFSKTYFSEEVNAHLSDWVAVIHQWLTDIFQNKLLPELTFADALQTNAIHELEFLFPVTSPLTHQAFNNFLNHNREIAAQLDFYTLEGMMKGFIDLIFMHDNKFYIIDYKTNHLGDHLHHYQQESLHLAMLTHYYDVQYLIYSVALMRYLQLRLPQFDYDEHFGGIFYLFVRGMEKDGTNGIYFQKPSKETIDALNQLMGAQS